MTVQDTRKRLVDYLTRGGVRRAPLREFLRSVSTELSDSAIFGGMIRDFGLGDARTFQSDIDIVTTATANEIYALIKRYEPVRNKFGGFRFSTAGMIFDVWSFADTWAIREGVVRGRNIDDLCQTTFFSLDAALFRLREHRLVTAQDYEVKLSQRILEINLVQHPSPENMARRAVRMAIAKNLSVAPELCEFIARRFVSDGTVGVSEYFISRLSSHLKLSPENPFRFAEQLPIWPLADVNVIRSPRNRGR